MSVRLDYLYVGILWIYLPVWVTKFPRYEGTKALIHVLHFSHFFGLCYQPTNKNLGHKEV